MGTAAAERRANIAQTIDALPDFRAEVREGWSRYIQSTYGIGESVEDSSAVQDTETLVVFDDEEARGAALALRQDFVNYFNYADYIDYNNYSNYFNYS